MNKNYYDKVNEFILFLSHTAMRQLIENPPFKRMEHNPLHTEDLVERLWKMMK